MNSLIVAGFLITAQSGVAVAATPVASKSSVVKPLRGVPCHLSHLSDVVTRLIAQKPGKFVTGRWDREAGRYFVVLNPGSNPEGPFDRFVVTLTRDGKKIQKIIPITGRISTTADIKKALSFPRATGEFLPITSACPREEGLYEIGSDQDPNKKPDASGKFDLVCDLVTTIRTKDLNDPNHPTHLTQTKGSSRFRLDLVENAWCEGDCGRISKFKAIGINELKLTDEKNGENSRVQVINRITGGYTGLEQWTIDSMETGSARSSGTCAKAPFTPMPERKF